MQIKKLEGTVTKEPVFRTTPNGHEITDLSITTGKNINYCVCWEKVAHAAKNLTAGERVCIKGFIQSRNYRKRKDDGFNIIPTIEISVLLLENPDGIKIAPISAPV